RPVCAEIMINNGAGLELADNQGRAPFHYAAYNNNERIVKLFLEQKVKINPVDKFDKTPLDYAVLKNNYKVKNLLADSNGLSFARLSAHDSLHWDDLSRIGALLRDRNINEKDYLGFTLLHYAAMYGMEDKAGFFLENGARINEKDRERKTPLHWAVINNRVGMARLFIENNAVVNPRDEQGRIPLHWAVINNNEEMVKLLVESLGFINSRDHRDRTPLFYAIKNNNYNIANYLLRCGAKY
ncbi:MAG: ankyrin repeat domain-containing protein, partial [Vulcanimicrobiota bacterium]